MSGHWIESDISPSSDDEGHQQYGKHEETDGGKKELEQVPGAHYADVTKKLKAEWLSGSWPLTPFDGSLPTHKRKAEWVRFRDQFERIVSCKAAVDSVTKLTGMKIFAGDYLLNIIEIQEKVVAEQTDDIYYGIS